MRHVVDLGGRPSALMTQEVDNCLSVATHIRCAGDGRRFIRLPERSSLPAGTPWALELADDAGFFRFLAFDLDAHGPASLAYRAHADADRLVHLLSSAGLTPLVCRSGPSDGRHVWVGLAQGVPAGLVATMARLARQLCPTLDISPLCNPATGCVRPPGSPHRDGGMSQVIDGDMDTLLHPVGTLAQVRAFTHRLEALVLAQEPDPKPAQTSLVPVDADGRLYMPGARHELTAECRHLIAARVPAGGDASAVLWAILCGAARARWHHAALATMLDDPAYTPGLEHARTERAGAGRQPRSPGEPARLLARQWDRAVRWVAAHPNQPGTDPTFSPRAFAVTSIVERVQSRADAACGRWSHGGGPADRRVLDAVCLWATQAIQPGVQADIRRLATTCGIGRETARTALIRLADDGWITRLRPAAGPAAATWTIDPDAAIHRALGEARSQAVPPRPSEAPPDPSFGAGLRQTWITTLTTRLGDATHDLFTPAGLGLEAGNIWAATTHQTQTGDELARHTGTHPASLPHTLDRLCDAGVLEHVHGGVRRPQHDNRQQAAEQRGSAGVLAARAARLERERVAWAWWSAELAWMRQPGRHKRPAHQPALIGDLTVRLGTYPRRPDGRADWKQAANTLTNDREHTCTQAA